MKFGGTSVGSAARMKEVARLIGGGEQKIVVLSAMAGTTNNLVEIANFFFKKNKQDAFELINTLEQKYLDLIAELYSTESKRNDAQNIINQIFIYLRSFSKFPFTSKEEKCILAQGELLSTAMFQLFLQEIGEDSVLLPALEFMRIDENGEPNTDFIVENIEKQLVANQGHNIYLTQGYICRNMRDEIDNLQRGGSDYTASLIGAAVKAEEIQIWTDIDGMHNNDPRFVEGTKPVSILNFDEAAELAYFGAKILHPTCILPARLNNIPVRLLNTMQPEAAGTLICEQSAAGAIRAVAAKDGITAIKIKSGRMLLAYGFLCQIFEIFEKYRTPIDMITTSEVGVSVTIDNPKHLENIVNELNKLGTVTVDSDMVIVCVVGDLPPENVGLTAKAVNALKDIPVRMISYGGSKFNISFLVKSEDKIRALQALNSNVF